MNSSMKIKELVKNGAAAFASQGVSFLLSILVSLLVPKVLGVEEYGYWQLFIFYSSYTGFFTFGLADGVYLVEGGASRNTIDKRKVNSSLWLALAYEIPIATVVVLLCALMDFGQEREFVISATAAYFVISSSWSSLGFVFQAMNERAFTRLLSWRTRSPFSFHLSPCFSRVAPALNPLLFATRFRIAARCCIAFGRAATF